MIVVKILSIIAVLIGVLLLGLSVPAFQETRTFVSSAKATEGVVTGVERRTVSSGMTRSRRTTVYDYTVRYMRGGDVALFTSEGHNSPDYAVGQMVRVLYTTGPGGRAAIDEFASLWSKAGLLFVIGGCLLGLGACNLWITAVPASRPLRTAVALRELRDAWREGRLTRDSEYQGLLVAFSFVGFIFLAIAIIVILFASPTVKVLLAGLLLYTLVQIVRGRRGAMKGRRAPEQ